MYLDASAIVAIALREAERDPLLESIAHAGSTHTSIVSAFEAVLAIGRETGDRTNAGELVKALLDGVGTELRAAGPELLPELAAAYARYGKGTGHPAQLNMGDCFSYAMAKAAGVPLLYKGDDFAFTDLA